MERKDQELEQINKEQSEELACLRKCLDEANQKHDDEIKQVRQEAMCANARLEQSIKELKHVNKHQTE